MKIWYLFLASAVIWMTCGLSVLASEPEYGFDYEEIQDAMDEMMPKDVKISFSDLVGELTEGKLEDVIEHLKLFLMEGIFGEMKSSKKLLLQMLGIVFVSAVFTNFSMAFSKTFIAETGFYLTYMILFTLLLTSFMAASQIASALMGNMMKFMSAFVPVFCLAVTFTGNIQTGIWYQQALVMGITFLEWILSKGVMGLIHAYVLISMVNQLSKEDMLSKCAQLTKTLADWILKTALGVILGLNFVQSLILPAFDTLKNGWAMRVTSAVPGVGDAMGTAMQTVIGSAVLIKNGIGSAGLCILAFLFLIPAVKMAVMALMYMAAQAVVQPVADKRILECLHSISDGILMLLKVEGTVFILFFLSMAMMTSASGAVFGG